MNSVAITGASGYVGSQMGEYFLRKGWRVLCLSRKAPSNPNLEHIPYQLGDAFPKLKYSPIDLLIHAAYDFSLRKREEIDIINVVGTETLFSSAKEVGVSRMILVSSLSAFEGTKSLYGSAKLAMEKIALGYGACAIRSGLVYGGKTGGMMGELINQVNTKTWIPVMAHGVSRLYPVHSDDLSELALQLATEPTWPPNQRTFIAAGRQGWTLEGIFKTLADKMGRRVHLIPIPARVIWFGLRCLEALGLKVPFRSDSVLSLLCANPDVGNNALYKKGAQFREFGDSSWTAA